MYFKENNIVTKKKTQCELQQVPLIGETTARILRDHGIRNVKQLAALSVDNPLSEKVSSFPLKVNYAKAIKSKDIKVEENIPSALDGIIGENTYFFDAEYDSKYTETGPYGAIALGWMDMNGKLYQLFLEDPEDESKMLKKFSEWVKKETPVLIAYSSNSAEVPELRKCFSRHDMSFTHIESSFFDLYAEVVFTQNVNKQKYFLPIVKSGDKPFGLKNVSEHLGYKPPDLKISNGERVQFEYKRYLREEHKKAKKQIKNDLLRYNQDDLKRTRLIYEYFKKKC